MGRISFIKASVLAGAMFGLVIVAGAIRLSGQAAPPEAQQFEAAAGGHETRAQWESAVQFPSINEVPPVREPVVPPPPTRSSFMATWRTVPGASGYFLDVSANSAFNSFLEGYHDLDVGNVNGRVVSGLTRGAIYYYRVRPYYGVGPGRYSETGMAVTESTTGLTIHPTFDSSIINHPNSAAIQAAVNRAISICEMLFNDPITIQIRFRYSTTGPNGDPLPASRVAQSDFVVYTVSWNTFISALRADASSSNDNVANASLPGSALSSSIRPSSAGGRAVGLNTPPAMFANGTVGNGGPYDGIVTLNAAAPYQFTRPPSSGNYDAQRAFEHEMDEVIGLGSRLNLSGSNLRPQDLFSWSSAGNRNITSSGTRYFSINNGVTNIVNFSQDSHGDFGDWFSESCPQSHPYVQNAFLCPGQYSDISATSPEGINLDVIGYDLVGAPASTPTPTPTPRPTSTPTGPPVVATNPATNVANFSASLNGTVNPNGLSTAVHFEYGLTSNYGSSTAIQNYSGGTTRNVVANLSNLIAGATYHFRIVGSNAAGTRYGADRTFTTPAARAVSADFNADMNPDLVPQRTSPHQTAVLYLNNNAVIGADVGPTLPAGWRVAGAADFNSDGHTDWVLFNSSTRQTVIVYLSDVTVVGAAFGPSLSAGWEVVATADFNADGHPDYVLYKAGTRETAIWHLNNNLFINAISGPPLPPGWNLAAVADFNGDGHPDYALFQSITGQTVIGYLTGGTVIGAAFGPTLPGGWPLVATADFSQDGHPDYLLYNPTIRQTAIGYLNNNVLINAALGPALPVGWSLVAP